MRKTKTRNPAEAGLPFCAFNAIRRHGAPCRAMTTKSYHSRRAPSISASQRQCQGAHETSPIICAALSPLGQMSHNGTRFWGVWTDDDERIAAPAAKVPARDLGAVPAALADPRVALAPPSEALPEAADVDPDAAPVVLAARGLARFVDDGATATDVGFAAAGVGLVADLVGAVGPTAPADVVPAFVPVGAVTCAVAGAAIRRPRRNVSSARLIRG
jgi:hypothetical protein